MTKSDCIDRGNNVIKISGYFFAKRSIVKSRKQSRESEWDWAELGKLDCSQAVTAVRTLQFTLRTSSTKKIFRKYFVQKLYSIILWELLLTCICSIVDENTGDHRNPWFQNSWSLLFCDSVSGNIFVNSCHFMVVKKI